MISFQFFPLKYMFFFKFANTVFYRRNNFLLESVILIPKINQHFHDYKILQTGVFKTIDSKLTFLKLNFFK